MQFLSDVIFGGLALMRDVLRLIGAHWRKGALWLWPFYLIWCVQRSGISLAVDRGLHVLPPSIGGSPESFSFGAFSLWFAAGLALYLPAAVMVHRLVLRPEAVAPPVVAAGKYLGWLVFIFLIIVVISIPVGTVVGLLGGLVQPSQLAGMAHFWLLVWGGLGLALGWLLIRYSLVLPAAAVGAKGAGLWWSWQVTAPVSRAILGFAALELLLQYAVERSVQLALVQAPLLGYGLYLALTPVNGVIALAVLTLLYSRLAPEGPLG